MIDEKVPLLNDIVRIDAVKQFGFTNYRICGLNIFSANGIKVPASADPRLIVLKHLAKKRQCSAHVGGLALSDIVYQPEELFGSNDGVYIHTCVGLAGGMFYIHGKDENSYFFPEVATQFWQAKIDDNDKSSLQYLIEAGAIALYVNPNTLFPIGMQNLLHNPPSELQVKLNPSQHDWINATVGIYSLAVICGHDGLVLECYVLGAGYRDAIDSAVDIAVQSVMDNSWYQQHNHLMKWNSIEQCLMTEKSL